MDLKSYVHQHMWERFQQAEIYSPEHRLLCTSHYILPSLTQTYRNNLLQHAEQLICLRESNTKLGPLSAPCYQGNHSEIHRLCTGTTSMAILFTSGCGCNPCHLPTASQTIPQEKSIRPPPAASPPTPQHTYRDTHMLPIVGFWVFRNSRATVTMAMSIVIVFVPVHVNRWAL